MQVARWEQSLSILSFFSTVALFFFRASQAVENGWGGARVEVARMGTAVLSYDRPRPG